MANFSSFPPVLRGPLLTAALLAGFGAAPTWAQSAKPSTQLLDYFTTQSVRQGLSDADAAQPSVTDFYRDAATGAQHAYLRQRVNGVDVFGAVGAVHTDRSGKPVWANQSFVPNAARLAPAATPTLTAEQAVVAASVVLGLPRPAGLTLVREARPADGLEFNNGGISDENIPVRLYYFANPLKQSEIHLAWEVSIAQLDGQHHWQVLVDAHTGKQLFKHDYVVSEATTFLEQNARNRSQRQVAAPAPARQTAARSTASPNSLNVFPVPLESPLMGNRVSVPLSSTVNTWSPYGWQVSQAPAMTPAFFNNFYSRLNGNVQLPRGNNVAAYNDIANNSQLYVNTNSPDAGATLDFDFPFTFGAGPGRNMDAGIVNLFYWNNMLHDVMASKGFDEAAGNFQYKNIGTTGLGNDMVRAEAQDGSGTNNANFSTPPDGQAGRMQMYLWTNPVRPTVTITAPASLAGAFQAGGADFGRNLADVGPICGNFVLVNDGVSAENGLHGCATPYANAAAVNGNIAVIMRGGCAQLSGSGRTVSSFAGKVRRAQQNGAIMAIIIDSVGTNTTISGMTGTDTVGIRIPSLFLRGVDGAAIRQALASGATVTGCGNGSADYDASFDNGIVSHEFGHGISTRLTGGPSNSDCLVSGSGNQAFQTMGEGWSDFFGLWMTTGNVATTTNPTGVTGRTPRYIGAYVVGEAAATGPGIRINPYTDDMTLNPHTYGALTSTQYNETHNIGEVWAGMLWDLNWQFIYRYGFNPDFLGSTGGNNMFLKLVLDGCKLQVCNPGFLDGRDAILRADSIANGGANSALIWTVFSRRGAGFSAVQGVRTGGNPTRAGIREAFDMPAGVTPAPMLNPTTVNIVTSPLGTTPQQELATKGSIVDAYPNPAQDQLIVRSQLSATGNVQLTLRDLVGRVAYTSTAGISELQRGITVNTTDLAAGFYVVQVNTNAGTFTTKVQVRH
jgi:extracellular elastinolytic metalloproteinase